MLLQQFLMCNTNTRARKFTFALITTVESIRNDNLNLPKNNSDMKKKIIVIFRVSPRISTCVLGHIIQGHLK